MIELTEGMIISIPVTVLDCHDRSNVRCQAGTRTVLLDGRFLTEAADLVAPPPPAEQDKLAGLADAIVKLQARLEAMEGKGSAAAGLAHEAGPSL